MYICCAKVAPKALLGLISFYDNSPGLCFYRVGLKKVQAIDMTDEFISILNAEMKKFEPTKGT